MKKIIAIIILVILILSVEHEKIISFFVTPTSEVLATVNGVDITFAEVELLYDMRHTQNFTTPVNVSELKWEYAEIIYKRIEQILVVQELYNRKLEVKEEDVQALEQNISLEYFLDESGVVDQDEKKDFKNKLQNLGIDYKIWQQQLRATIEQERLSQELAKFIIINSDDTLTYIAQNPDLGKRPAQVDFTIIHGKAQESVEAISLENQKDLEELQTHGFKIKRALLTMENMPKNYKKLLVGLPNKSFSAVGKETVGKEKGEFFIIYIHSATYNENRSAMDMYTLAEKAILEEKIPAAYDEWLFETISNSDINIAKEFLPKELPSKREKANILSFIKTKNDDIVIETQTEENEKPVTP